MRILVKFKDDDIRVWDCCEISCIGPNLSIYEPVPYSDEVNRLTIISLSNISYFQIVEDFDK